MGTLQAVLLFGIIGAIFFAVPNVNKMAQRKPDPAFTTSTQNTPQNVTGSTSTNAGATVPTSVTPQPEGEYDISVYNVETDETTGVIAVTLEINNPSTVTLKFDPLKQFKMVGLTTKAEKLPTTQPGKPSIAAGDIKPGQTVKGILYIQRFQDQKYELRFFSQIGDKDFTVVPLIAVPVDQQQH